MCTGIHKTGLDSGLKTTFWVSQSCLFVQIHLYLVLTRSRTVRAPRFRTVRTPNFSSGDQQSKTLNYQLPFNKRIKLLHQAKYLHSMYDTWISYHLLKLGFPTLLVASPSFTFVEKYPQTWWRSSQFPWFPGREEWGKWFECSALTFSKGDRGNCNSVPIYYRPVWVRNNL